MALKENSASTNPCTTTIDASITLLLAAMQRIGERIECRDARIDPCIEPSGFTDADCDFGGEPSFDLVFTTPTPSTVHDEPIFNIDPVFDEETGNSTTTDVGVVFFDQGPIFDEEPDNITTVGCDLVIFNAEPVFDVEHVSDEDFEAGPVFDQEPDEFATAVCGAILFDGPNISTTMGCDIVFDIGPIFDEEPGDLVTADCSVIPFDGLDITSATAGHNRLNPMATVAAPTDVDVEPNNTNSSAPSTYSTKCSSGGSHITASAVVFVTFEEQFTDPVHAVATPTAITVVLSNVNAVAPSTFSTKGSSVIDTASVMPTNSLKPSSSAASTCIMVNQDLQGLTNLVPVLPVYASLGAHQVFGKMYEGCPCSPATISSVSDAISTFNVTNTVDTHHMLEELHFYATMSANVNGYTQWQQQPWPPPSLLNKSHISVKIRPIPWPFFILSSVGAMSWDGSSVWKPPWSLLIFHQCDSCSPTILVLSCAKSMKCKLGLVVKSVQPLMKFSYSIMVILMSTGCATTSLPAKLEILGRISDCQVPSTVQLDISVSFGGFHWPKYWNIVVIQLSVSFICTNIHVLVVLISGASELYIQIRPDVLMLFLCLTWLLEQGMVLFRELIVLSRISEGFDFFSTLSAGCHMIESSYHLSQPMAVSSDRTSETLLDDKTTITSMIYNSQMASEFSLRQENFDMHIIAGSRIRVLQWTTSGFMMAACCHSRTKYH